MTILFYLCIIIINALVFFNRNKIIKLVNIYDKPNEDRKKHLHPTPLIGGLFILVSLILYFFFQFFFNELLIPAKIPNTLFIGSLFFFILGIYDDKYNINPNIKLLLSIIFLLILIFNESNILLSYIVGPPLSTVYPLFNFSTPITILCFLLFINALNMFDGINLQCGLYVSIIFLILIIKGVFPFFLLALLISLIFFLIQNYNGKSFLGDNGALCLGFIISYIFIYDYNLNFNFSIEEIFLLMYLPGLDLCRVALFRILIKKHPFSPDRNHIHHYLISRYDDFFGCLLLMFIAFVPYILNLLLSIPYIIIFFSITLYSYLIINLKQKESSN